MSIYFFFKCYFVGIISTLGLGPIFILVFNRAAAYGFWVGIFSAFGAATADGILFYLGSAGILAFLAGFHNVLLVLDLVGGIFLLVMGIMSFKKKVEVIQYQMVNKNESLMYIPLKPFFMSFINPLSIAFFTIWSMKVFPENSVGLSWHYLIISSGLVCLGTLSGLSIVSFAASILGLAINPKGLAKISKFTGTIFMATGVYFLQDFIIKIFNFIVVK